MTSHQTENNAPKNGASKNTAPAAGHGPHGPHGASEDPQNIYPLKDAPILKALLSLGVPMALGLAITSIYNVVNSYFECPLCNPIPSGLRRCRRPVVF